MLDQTTEVTFATRRCATAVLAVSIALTVSTRSGAASTDAILTWNINAGEAAKAACLAPSGASLPEVRMYAMAHVAMHDALNAISRRSPRTPSTVVRGARRRRARPLRQLLVT